MFCMANYILLHLHFTINATTISIKICYFYIFFSFVIQKYPLMCIQVKGRWLHSNLLFSYLIVGLLVHFSREVAVFINSPCHFPATHVLPATRKYVSPVCLWCSVLSDQMVLIAFEVRVQVGKLQIVSLLLLN